LDEAQDIYPIQWETLGRIGIQGGWTIVGDLNQRRTDHTYGSWEIVSELLGLENKESESPLHVLKIGYRSTSQIIRFADQLLPKAERHIQSVQQNGVKPRVIREAQVALVPTTVIVEAEKLLSQIQVGTVAVISVNTSVFSRVLVKAGWKKNQTRNSWENASGNLYLLNPDQARGLEFDGVVVVEPADFPENLGRAGVLYTSLTRANKLLTVVHHRALPRGMKREL
jgi:DNA helicase IV